MNGLVAAGHPDTAEAGATLLRAGGNAVDAVVAAAAASFVAEPCLTSPGGGGMMLLSDGSGWTALDCFGVVPGRGLGPVGDIDFHEVAVDFGPTLQHFHVGRGSVAVPGLLDGLVAVHRRRGRLPLSEVLAPAVHAARDGVRLTPSVAFMLRIIEPIARLTPGTRALFGAEQGMPEAGAILRNRPLGSFLEAVGRDADAALRDLWRPALLDAFGPARGGRLSPADLDGWAPTFHPARRTQFAEGWAHTVPTRGGDVVAVGLRAADRLGLCGRDDADPAWWRDVTATGAAQSKARAQGVPDDETLDRWLSGTGAVEPRDAGRTTHVGARDADGNAAALTHSNGEGCGHVLDGLGVHVNNFLGEEDINALGFHRAPAGSPLATAMAPTAWNGPGREALVGSGGSKRIRSALVAVLVQLARGRAPQDAIARPRTHVEDGRLAFERRGLPDGAEAALRAAWPDAVVFEEPSMFFGGVHAVGLDGTEAWGAADPRRGAAVARA